MTRYSYTKDELAPLKAFREDCRAKIKEKFCDFDSNTLGMKDDGSGDWLVCDYDRLDEILTKVPRDFRANLSAALKPFMDESSDEWLDAFRIWAFACLDENDGNLRALSDEYDENGLHINLYNGLLRAPNLKAYEALFGLLNFLSIEELCAIKNIVEADNERDGDYKHRHFLENRDFLWAFLIWRDMVGNVDYFSIIFENNLEVYDYTDLIFVSENIYQELNFDVYETINAGLYAKRQFISVSEIESILEGDDEGYDEDENDVKDGYPRGTRADKGEMLEFIIGKIQ